MIPGQLTHPPKTAMTSWLLTALVLTGIAAILGFTGVAGSATGFAKALFAVLLVITLGLAGWLVENRRSD